MTDEQISNIPEIMRAARQWVGFKNKVPRDAKTGRDGKSTDCSTWCDFNTALEGAVKYALDGVGYVFVKESFICGIDIDTCRDPETGALSVQAQEIVDSLDSYTEISPSGFGVHIYVEVAEGFSLDGFKKNGIKMPPNGIERYVTKDGKQVKKEPEIEFYTEGRYFTVTGNAIGTQRTINERTVELYKVLERYAKKEKKKQSAVTNSDGGGGLSLSDNAVIDKAVNARDGAKFQRLYSGDFSDFKSRSEADLSLCSTLAFWCNRDEAQIDRIFRSSALMRDKWDERHGAQTYGQKTISTAVENCTAVYNPHEYRQQVIERTIENYSPESFDSSTHDNQPTSTEPVNSGAWVYEDNGKIKINCPVLADFIREHYHYFFAYGDARGLKELYLYRDGVYVLQSDDDFKGFIKRHIPRECYRSKDVEEIFKDLHTDPSGGKHSANIDDLNADEDIINFRNGIYHLSSQTLTPHDPRYLSTIQYPLDYKPTSECHNGGVFDSFINYHLGGDVEQVQLILEFMGVALSNIDASRMKKALFVIGEGNTGKSQLKNLLTRLIGSQNCAPLELSDLEQRFGTSALYQKRLAGCNDMSCMRVDELTTFKKLTGGDVISAEFKGKPHFSFKFRGLLWFCANEPPLFGGDKGRWVYDRIVIVKPTGVAYPLDTPPFDGIVYADPHLTDKLWSEREYIVSRAIAALQDVVKRGYRYNITHENTEQTRAYLFKNSSTLTFFQECCTERPNNQKYDSCNKARLYRVYLEWCKINSRNNYRDSKSEFRRAIDSIGRGKIITLCGREYYADFTLTNEAKQEYVAAYGYDAG